MRTPALLSILILLAMHVSAEPTYPSQSIYHSDAALTGQSGKQVRLDLHRGQPVLITMFYGSCPMTCPVLIDTLRAIEAAVPPQQRARLRVVMISIDPERDTPERLRRLVQERRIDESRWTLARADAATVRQIAALLNIQYRRLPDGNYNHSNVISLLSPSGEIRKQTSVLGKADQTFIEALMRTASPLPSS